mmetsp:Transcript_9999/g.8948  ORF Transcript_9999/g.8948 Transcript_9999/m.8948 type:complete len:409 (+) Transcript_9999:22-1248(+)
MSGFGSSSFGASSAFGSTAPSFSNLGSSGSANVPAFGSTAPAFGSSAPALGSTIASGFGSSTSAPSFGSTAALGSTATSGFGLSGTATAPAFGSTIPAGSAPTTSSFGGFNSSSSISNTTTTTAPNVTFGNTSDLTSGLNLSTTTSNAQVNPASNTTSTTKAGELSFNALGNTNNPSTSSSYFNQSASEPNSNTTTSNQNINPNVSTSSNTNNITESTLPAEYSNMTIRGIIKAWESEITQEIELFDKQNYKIGLWDDQIRENEKTLNSLTDEVHKLIYYQNQAKSICDGIDEYQKELNDKLNNLSILLDKEIIDQQSIEANSEDYERDAMYKLTNDLFAQINQIELNLSTLSDKNATITPLKDGYSTVNTISEVLNAHENSLLSISLKTRELTNNISSIKQNLIIKN